MRPTDVDDTDVYFARAACGCIEVIHMANRRLAYYDEADVIEIIRDGGTWERKPIEEVRALPMKCGDHS